MGFIYILKKKKATGHTANLDKLPGGERWRREREKKQMAKGVAILQRKNEKSQSAGKACLGFQPVAEDFKKGKRKTCLESAEGLRSEGTKSRNLGSKNSTRDVG